MPKKPQNGARTHDTPTQGSDHTTEPYGKCERKFYTKKIVFSRPGEQCHIIA
jgi:hypothetical protein